jgi:hypothetical protein
MRIKQPDRIRKRRGFGQLKLYHRAIHRKKEPG